jgi:hypothetical protein
MNLQDPRKAEGPAIFLGRTTTRNSPPSIKKISAYLGRGTTRGGIKD